MWNMLHKLRRAMVRPGRDRLAGKVEIDETYIGGLSEGTPGRGADKKALVVIAAQIADKGSLGRVRMKMIDRATTENLVGFMEESVEPGSTIITDGWAGYSDKVMAAKGYEHVLDEVKPGKDALPHVHMVISLLKRVLLGTFQGGVAFSHLSYYLDEFTFRFNRRTSRNRGKLFRRLLENNVDLPPTTWKELVGPSEKTDEQPQEELD
jgi:transposase-like protein